MHIQNFAIITYIIMFHELLLKIPDEGQTRRADNKANGQHANIGRQQRERQRWPHIRQLHTNRAHGRSDQQIGRFHDAQRAQPSAYLAKRYLKGPWPDDVSGAPGHGFVARAAD